MQNPLSNARITQGGKKKRFPLSGARVVPVSNWISCCVSRNCSRGLFLSSLPLASPLRERGWSRCARARIATRDFAYVAANVAKNSTPVIAAEDLAASFVALPNARNRS